MNEIERKAAEVQLGVLKLQHLLLKSQIKGDTPGHPFRGNQYSGGGGGGVSNSGGGSPDTNSFQNSVKKAKQASDATVGHDAKPGEREYEFRSSLANKAREAAANAIQKSEVAISLHKQAESLHTVDSHSKAAKAFDQVFYEHQNAHTDHGFASGVADRNRLGRISLDPHDRAAGEHAAAMKESVKLGNYHRQQAKKYGDVM